jgi:superfamily II DNA or RNA helicase
MQPPHASLQFSEGTLVLSGWNALAIERVFEGVPWIWDPRARLWRTEAMHYDRVRAQIASKAVGTQDENVNLPDLRAEQAAAVSAWKATHRGIVVMPTGTGKTEVALRIMTDLRCSTLVVAPIRDLMYQWHSRILKGLGYDSGIIGDSLFNIRPISVTTYDSACIHMPRLGDRFQLIIFDECHHLPGPIRGDAAKMSAAMYRLGLTATLERSDGRQHFLNEWLGPIAYRLEIGDVRGKSLADYEIVRIPVHLNSLEQKRYEQLAEKVATYVYERRKEEAEFDWQQLCNESAVDGDARRILIAFREKQSIEDRAVEKLRVLEDLFRLHYGTPMIIFAGSNAMARDVSERFLIPCLLNHCGKAERIDYLEGLRDGVYPAIVSNQVLDEGVDIPAVKIAIVIGGMGSSRQAKQRLGRILRRSGNERAVLYEVVCNDTTEVARSRKRRTSDAYSKTRRKLSKRQTISVDPEKPPSC